MIDMDNIKKSQARKIVRLFEERTRALVTARIGPIGFPGCADFFTMAQEKEDELQEFIFGTSSIVRLGEMWGILKEEPKKTKHYCGVCGRVQYRSVTGLSCKGRKHYTAASVSKKKAKKIREKRKQK